MKITYKDSWDNPEHRQESYFNWGTVFLFLTGLAFGAIIIASITLSLI